MTFLAMKRNHASQELIDAMSGIAPPFYADLLKNKVHTACGTFAPEDRRTFSFNCWGSKYGNTSDDAIRVDCRRCLMLMRAATDPVRWDYLAERGMVGL